REAGEEGNSTADTICLPADRRDQGDPGRSQQEGAPIRARGEREPGGNAEPEPDWKPERKLFTLRIEPSFRDRKACAQMPAPPHAWRGLKQAGSHARGRAEFRGHAPIVEKMRVGASTDTSRIVTRFAPSPTGFLHIGG